MEVFMAASLRVPGAAGTPVLAFVFKHSRELPGTPRTLASFSHMNQSI